MSGSSGPPYAGSPQAKDIPGAATVTGHAAEASAAGLPTLDVRDLLQGSREAVLLLDGEPYRLRITARDKLILTK
jgi:hemin uptake protein HemP